MSSRYPYTFAADRLRMAVGDDYGKGLISRAAASTCMREIALALGMKDHQEIAEALARLDGHHPEGALTDSKKEA
jgi:hypothetical protein